MHNVINLYNDYNNFIKHKGAENLVTHLMSATREEDMAKWIICVCKALFRD